MFEFINFLLIFINIIIIYFTLRYRNYIAERLNLIDFPSQDKIHKKPTPLLGGILVYLSYLIFVFNSFVENYEIFSVLIFISSTVFFIIGILDDKKNLGYKFKFFLFILVAVISLLLNEKIILNEIYFETFNTTYKLGFIWSIILTVLCLLLLINASNLSDGINGLCLSIGIFWFLYLFLQTNNLSDNFNFIFFILILIIIFFNIYKGNIFLGNSGSHFIGAIIGLSLIYNYNLILIDKNLVNKISVEEIFLVLMLPGIDMLRLFLFRIFNGQNPFKPDKLHLHHFLVERFNLYKSLIIYNALLISPLILYKFTNFAVHYIIITFLIFYLIILFYLKIKNNLK